MKRKFFGRVAAALLAVLICVPAAADNTRYIYDFNFPQGVFNQANFRASLRGLHQMDMMALRPLAGFEIDAMEYGTNGAAQAQYAGTGVTVSYESTNKQEGTYSIKAVCDGTADRTFGRTYSINLDAFSDLLVWERSSVTSDTYKFYLEDSDGNQSRWNITSSGTAGTFVEHSFDLSTPDSNSGTAADLSDIVEYGFMSLSASATYYFDTISLETGMAIAVMGSNLGSYYQHVHFAGEPVTVDAQLSPALTAPTANPRIDILVIDSAGTLSWVAGTEASTPVAPWASVPVAKMPIAEVYCKTSMTKVVPYEDKDVETTEGYILSDVRPFLQKPITTFTGLSDAPSSITALYFLRGNAAGTKLEFAALTLDPLPLGEQASDPAVAANQGKIYAKDVSGSTEVFARSDAGIVQITDGGKIKGSVPAGSVQAYAGSTAPDGWLFCYGQAVSRTTYSDLYTTIGTTFGTGDGSTTFNVPDLRGRTVIALDNMGGSSANRVVNAQADVLGGVMGTETHTLTITEMPAHTHNVQTYQSSGSSAYVYGYASNNGGSVVSGAALTTGGGGAHNNMQPTMAMNYIIKY